MFTAEWLQVTYVSLDSSPVNEEGQLVHFLPGFQSVPFPQCTTAEAQGVLHGVEYTPTH